MVTKLASLAPIGLSAEIHHWAGCFKAWWDGYDMPERMTAYTSGVFVDDFDSIQGIISAFTGDPRFIACERLWGMGRLRAGDAEVDAALATALGVEAGHKLAVFGMGLGGAVNAIASVSEAWISVFEWRENFRDAGRDRLIRGGYANRVAVNPLDPKKPKLSAGKFDAALCLEELSFVDDKAHWLQMVHTSLRDNGIFMAIDYVVDPKFDLSKGRKMFSSADPAPQFWTEDQWDTGLNAAGFDVLRREDMTGLVIKSVRNGFSKLDGTLDNLGKAYEKCPELVGPVLTETVKEAACAKALVAALESGQVKVYRFLAMKPRAGQAPKEEAETGPRHGSVAAMLSQVKSKNRY